MPALALAVVAIALPDCINPSLIGTALYLAVGPSRARRTAVFAAAAFAVTFAGGVALALGLGDLLLSLVPKPSPATRYALLLAAGLVLVAGGVVAWWRREALVERVHPVRPRGGGDGSAALLGAGVAGIELLSAFPYFAAIAMVVGSSVSVGGKLFLLFLYNVIYALPLIAIAVVCAAMGSRADTVLEPFGRWTAKRWPHVVAPLAVVAGVAVGAYGAVHLV